MRKKINILIVEDEIIIANDIKRALEKFQYNVVDIVKSGEKALEIAKKTKPDIVLVDILLEGFLDGFDITDTIQKEYNIPVIYVTAYSDRKTLKEAKLTAPYGYVYKPFDDKELYSSIEMALYKFEMDNGLKQAKQKVEDLHNIAVELATCESKIAIFEKTASALKELLGIENFAFYTRIEDQLIIQTRQSMKLFKPKYQLTEGIIGEVFGSDNIVLFNSKDLHATDADWKNVRSAIGCTIGTNDVFIAVSHDKNRFNFQTADMLKILFNHTQEALKRIEYENLLKKKAIIDPLTNVYNRLFLDQAIKYEIKLAKRYSNEIGFIVIDINNFKEINDNNGHKIGDKVLQFIAALLVDQARESDNVIRTGGDEFLLMLPQTGEAVKVVENRLRKKIITANSNSEFDFDIGLALGSSYWNLSMNKSIENVVEEADKKMYIDKSKKSNKK